jgi:hypothetical protein
MAVAIETFTITCEYMFFTYKSMDDEILHEEDYTCKGLIEYECDARMYYVEGVSKNHTEGKTRRDVHMLLLHHGSELEYLPVDLHIYFSYLEVYTCDKCKLIYIDSEDFEKFPDLQVISFKGNRIKFLPGELFKFTPNLLSVDFSENPIQVVGEGFFDNIPQLRQIYFLNTACHPGDTHYPVDEQKQIIRIQCVPINRSTGDEDYESLEDTDNEQSRMIAPTSRTAGGFTNAGRGDWIKNHREFCLRMYTVRKNVQIVMPQQ